MKKDCQGRNQNSIVTAEIFLHTPINSGKGILGTYARLSIYRGDSRSKAFSNKTQIWVKNSTANIDIVFGQIEDIC